MTNRELALMNAIKKVFPNTTNLLCIWHIEKNVLAHCKKHFDAEGFDNFMASWINVAYSTTTTMFEYNWAEFELSYQAKKVALEYIKKTWLPWKEMFVSAWTDNYLHLGNHASSRAEGAHAKLKLYLQVSTGGFQGVKEKIFLAITNEFNEIKVKLAYEKMHVLHICDVPVFKELLYNTWPLSKKEIAISMITRLLNESDTFFEPLILRPKGRPPKAKKKRGVNSTTRDPSRFELVESSQTYNPSSSTSIFQMNNEVFENDLIDLNAYPTFSSDDMHLG
ncbi:hypothetical protein LXL04_003537 [Taraxacum kok-saghyz]